MKSKFFLTIALILGLFVGAFAASGEPENGFEVKTYTLKELRSIYGNNIRLADDLVLDETTEISMVLMANPCAGTGMQPCGAAEAQARNYARAQANSCCCVFTYGWECCDPGTGTMIAALFITVPTNCH
jgi:hypothetical protein